MGDLFPHPAALERVVYTKLYFHLEVCDYFDLPPLGLLQLRREFIQALNRLRQIGDSASVVSIERLLQPKPPVDPGLRRLVQKPSPALVLTADLMLQGLIEPKQRIVLPVLFLGNGVTGHSGFRRLLVELGLQGLYAGSGLFRLEAIEAEDNSGLRSMLWLTGEAETELIPPINDLSWWLQRQQLEGDHLCLDFCSPTRLLRQKKPLFKSDFLELFPFVLRRVTSMLASHCGIEPVSDPAGLIRQAEQVEVVVNRLHWQDWRHLNAVDAEQGLGGLLGSIELRGAALADLHWLLQLGSLLNVGKGAAYGSGQYRLRSPR